MNIGFGSCSLSSSLPGSWAAATPSKTAIPNMILFMGFSRSIRETCEKHEKVPVYCVIPLFFHVSIESDARGRKVHVAHEGERLLCAEFAVHAVVLPFNRERTAVTDCVLCAHDLIKVDIPMSQRAEVPAAPQIAERKMGSQNSGSAVQGYGGIFHVDVIDLLGELA